MGVLELFYLFFIFGKSLFITLELLFCTSTLLILFSVNLFSVYLLVASGNSHLIFTFTKCLFINWLHLIIGILFYIFRNLYIIFYIFWFSISQIHLLEISKNIFLLSHIWIFGYLVLYFCNFRFIIISFHILLFNIGFYLFIIYTINKILILHFNSL